MPRSAAAPAHTQGVAEGGRGHPTSSQLRVRIDGRSDVLDHARHRPAGGERGSDQCLP